MKGEAYSVERLAYWGVTTDSGGAVAPVAYGVRRQSEAATALWLVERTRILRPESKAVSRCPPYGAMALT